jgi:hypothetical protein
MMRCLIILLYLTNPSIAQEYADSPQSLGAGARALGVGSAYTAVSDDATAIYWNPAGLTQMGIRQAHAQHAEQFGGTVNHDILTVGIPSDLGAFAVGLVRVGVDGIVLTDLEDPSMPVTPDNRPIASGTTGTSDYTLALGYGRVIRPHLSLGATLKMIWRNLSAGDGTGYGLDLGVHCQTGDWRFGAILTDATRTRITFDSGSADRIKTTLTAGVAYSRETRLLNGRTMLTGSALLSGTTSRIDGGHRLRIGAEYIHISKAAARIGLEGDHLTMGAGMSLLDHVSIDVAFLENGDLDNTYRISASVGF